MTEPTPPTHSSIVAPKGIGVFICSCGGVISRKVDEQRLRLIAAADPKVRDVLRFDRCCGEPALGEIKLSLMAGDIDRFIVIGCSARTASDRFLQLAGSAGVCPELVTFCDVLDMCGSLSRAEAQAKSERMVLTSLKRCAMLQETPRIEVEPLRTALVVGNGPSAITVSRVLLDEGLDVVVVNPAQRLEESDHQSAIPLEGGALGQMADAAGDRFRVFNFAEAHSLSGHFGNLTVTISKDGEMWKETVGGVIVALDKVESFNPLLSRFPGSITQEGFESKLRALERMPRNIVMVAMDEVGGSERSPMSTHDAVHHAMHAKGLSPSSQITVVTREVYAFGQCEVGYRKAQEMGVRFIRSDMVPSLDGDRLAVDDVHSGMTMRIPADLIVVDNHSESFGTAQVAKAFRLPLASDGGMARSNPKCRPVASHVPGVLLCGSASEMNLGAGPTMSAKAAAHRIASLLRSRIVLGGNVAEVDQERCSTCLTCVRTCPFHAPSIGKEGKAEVDIGNCQGCGMCAAACPSKAIQVYSYRDDQIDAEVTKALEDVQ
ncbi:MAG TPA: 4Fe-4S binding protein [Methanomassiliicoccales archaeon]|jgi:heterodisulfide reductase subunit A-like polyferredoxin